MAGCVASACAWDRGFHAFRLCCLQVTCPPSRFRFRWAYGRYSALRHTSVCISFGYRSFSCWSCLPLGPGRKSPRYIYIYLLVCDHWPTALSCWLLGPVPAAAECGQSLCYGWVAYGFGWDFSSLSLLRFLYFPWLFTVGVGGFLMSCTSVGVFWFVVFRPVRSSLGSAHSTGRFGVGQGQRALLQGRRDGL